jgi:hypothetical protein
MIRFIGYRKRIIIREALESSRIEYLMQDRNRGFISLLAIVYANGTALPVGLIYKGKTSDLQNS